MSEITHCVQSYTVRSPFNVNCEKKTLGKKITLAPLLMLLSNKRCVLCSFHKRNIWKDCNSCQMDYNIKLQFNIFCAYPWIKDKHFDLKVLQTPNIYDGKRKLFKIEECGNPKVDNEGNKDSQRQNFLLWG